MTIGIVECRDKDFELDLKLLFIIVDCFSGRFPSKFFTVKLVYFNCFPESSYLLFIYYSVVHDIDICLF